MGQDLDGACRRAGPVLLNWWMLSLPLPVEANVAFYAASMAAGYVCLLMSGTWMSRLLRTTSWMTCSTWKTELHAGDAPHGERVFGEPAYALLLQEEVDDGYINVVNPFRASIVLGTPGAESRMPW